MKVLIIGAGGHARVIADALLCQNRLGANYEVIGFLDDNEALKGRKMCNLNVLGKISEMPNFEHEAIIVGIGDNPTRQKLYLKFKELGENIITVIHPRATIAPDVKIADGTVIFAGVVINCGAKIYSNVILNTSCTVGHDVIVNSHAQIAPGVNLAGGVVIGEGAFICIGSSVNQGKKIGDWAIVGSGASVVCDVPAHEKVLGVPAKAQCKKNEDCNMEPSI